MVDNISQIDYNKDAIKVDKRPRLNKKASKKEVESK